MILETRRLVLRDYNKRDATDIAEGLNNMGVSKWLAYVPYPYTRKDAKEWIRRCAEAVRKGKKRTNYDFAIVLKSENRVIGGVGLGNVNRVQGLAGGGIWLNAKYHGHGYGTEALGECIKFAFTKLKLRRIELGFFKGNPTSFRMQKKFGFRVEGMRRKGFRCMADGRLKDEYITGLLKEEWKK